MHLTSCKWPWSCRSKGLTGSYPRLPLHGKLVLRISEKAWRHGGDTLSLNRQLKLSRWSSALRILNDAQSTKLKIDAATVSTLVCSCSKTSHWQRSQDILYFMPRASLRLSSICHSSLSSSTVRADKWARALAIKDEMPKLLLASDQLARNIGLSAHAKAGWVRASEMLVCPVDSASFNIVLASCADWRQSQDLLRVAGSRTLQADSIGMTSALTSSRWQTAVSALVSLQARQTQVSKNAYTAIAGACDGWQWPLELLHKAARCSIEIDQVFRMSISRALRDQWNVALGLFDAPVTSMFLSSLKWPQALDKLTNALTKPCKARSSGKAGLDVDTLDEVFVNTAIGNFDWQMCIDWLKRMVFSRLRPDAHSYSITLAGMRAGEWQGALALLENSEDRAIVSGVLVSAAQTACLEGMDWKSPLQLLSRVDRGDGPRAMRVAQTVASSACSRCSKWTRFLQVLSSMRATRLQTDANDAIYADSNLYAKRGSWRAITEFALNTWSSSCASSGLTLSAFCTSGIQLGKWPQSLYLLRRSMRDSACFTSLSFLCGYVQNQQLLAHLLEFVSRIALGSLQGAVVSLERSHLPKACLCRAVQSNVDPVLVCNPPPPLKVGRFWGGKILEGFLPCPPK